LGISVDSCCFDRSPVGLFAGVSWALGADVADDDVEPPGVVVVALDELLVDGVDASGAAGVTTVVEDDALGVGTV